VCKWLNREAGLWYPDTFSVLQSGLGDFPAQALGGVPRTNGPFSEPAALAAYLGRGDLCLHLVLCAGTRGRWRNWCCRLSVIILFMCTSTTGYVVIAVGGGIAAVVWHDAGAAAGGGAAVRGWHSAAGTVVLGLLMLIAMQPKVGDSVQEC